MSSRVSARVQVFLAACAAIATILVVPAGARAATVVDGDFETGNLTGWQLSNVPPEPGNSGNWFAYTGTASPVGEFAPPVPPPPAGKYAAITAQGGPGTHILYQDIALEPNYTHQLSLLVYYRSETPLATPSPETLEANGPFENQQYRIDVMKPTAPIASVSSSDILATVFATSTGSPQELGPSPYTVNLSAFAGQTVRLRFVEVDNQGYFAAGTDSVAIASTPPSNAFSFGKTVLNEKNGAAKLQVTIPGPGTLAIADVKKAKKRVKTKTIQKTGGTFYLPVTPTKSTLKALQDKGKLKVKVAVTFTPTGGLAATQTRKLTLRLAPK
jgi:hypothetical protein